MECFLLLEHPLTNSCFVFTYYYINLRKFFNALFCFSLGKAEDALLIYSDGGTNQGVQKNTVITFRELHNSYGRPILQDYNIWKRQQREIIDQAVGNLISL